MKTSYGKGLATRTDTESCGDGGNIVGEALTGVDVGWVVNAKVKASDWRPHPDRGKAR